MSPCLSHSAFYLWSLCQYSWCTVILKGQSSSQSLPRAPFGGWPGWSSWEQGYGYNLYHQHPTLQTELPTSPSSLGLSGASRLAEQPSDVTAWELSTGYHPVPSILNERIDSGNKYFRALVLWCDAWSCCSHLLTMRESGNKYFWALVWCDAWNCCSHLLT